MTKTLIVITGAPATGKTTLGRKISPELNIPYLCRDEIKEIMFDSLGWSTREWSRELGLTSFDLLYFFIEKIMQTNSSFIIETAFNAEYSNPQINSLCEKYGYTPVQIFCHCDNSIRKTRFHERFNYGNRHPGHVDHTMIMEDGDAPKFKLDLAGENLIEIDTTEPDKINWQQLILQIKIKLQ